MVKSPLFLVSRSQNLQGNSHWFMLVYCPAIHFKPGVEINYGVWLSFVIKITTGLIHRCIETNDSVLLFVMSGYMASRRHRTHHCPLKLAYRFVIVWTIDMSSVHWDSGTALRRDCLAREHYFWIQVLVISGVDPSSSQISPLPDPTTSFVFVVFAIFNVLSCRRRRKDEMFGFTLTYILVSIIYLWVFTSISTAHS